MIYFTKAFDIEFTIFLIFILPAAIFWKEPIYSKFFLIVSNVHIQVFSSPDYLNYHLYLDMNCHIYPGNPYISIQVHPLSNHLNYFLLL